MARQSRRSLGLFFLGGPKRPLDIIAGMPFFAEHHVSQHAMFDNPKPSLRDKSATVLASQLLRLRRREMTRFWNPPRGGTEKI
eukprot:4248991-Pleurochrysis_carterae.AAC.4